MSELRNLYLEFLREEGYRPTIDDDGDLRFKIEGRSYYINVDEKDPQFFHFVYPAFWEIEDEDERERAREAINKVHIQCKAVKLFIVNDNVFATIELLLIKPEDARELFERAVGAMRNGVRTFVDTMRNEGEQEQSYSAADEEEDEDEGDGDGGFGGIQLPPPPGQS